MQRAYLLSTGAAAQMLGVSTEWVRRLVAAGVLQVAAVDQRGCLLFEPREVMYLRTEREAGRVRGPGRPAADEPAPVMQPRPWERSLTTVTA